MMFEYRLQLIQVSLTTEIAFFFKFNLITMNLKTFFFTFLFQWYYINYITEDLDELSWNDTLDKIGAAYICVIFCLMISLSFQPIGPISICISNTLVIEYPFVTCRHNRCIRCKQYIQIRSSLLSDVWLLMKICLIKVHHPFLSLIVPRSVS